uniref:BLOC-1-related complex subunit 5-like n=1 Tax=Ciona intestinalis TaxID=7719 RepID=UPI000180CE8A|nr:BLOC-1-related complex subunit 5-like [Ciona intestinalis]|eukprot:XP_002122836.1 BLOC-1-related complex subunit 5-like [Ciona intestinalis]
MGNEQSTLPNKGNVSTNSEPEVVPNKNKGIVVVQNKKEEPKDQLEENLTKLGLCPKFQPLLPNSLTVPDSRPLTADLSGSLDVRACLKVCARLQDHLNQCATAEVDKVGVSVMLHLTERQRAFAKHAEHSRKVDDISTTLNRVRMNLEQTLLLVDDLNMKLPENLRLEKLSL